MKHDPICFDPFDHLTPPNPSHICSHASPPISPLLLSDLSLTPPLCAVHTPSPHTHTQTPGVLSGEEPGNLAQAAWSLALLAAAQAHPDPHTHHGGSSSNGGGGGAGGVREAQAALLGVLGRQAARVVSAGRGQDESNIYKHPSHCFSTEDRPQASLAPGDC